MTLIDCVTFSSENDVFLLRYKELSPYVDKFIVLEARETHRGKPKALSFAYDHLPKVEHLILDHYPIVGDDDQAASDREWFGRDYFTYHLGAQPTDLIMLSDVDEIPNLSNVDTDQVYALSTYNNVFAFEQYLSYYYINYRADYKWYGTKLAQRKSFSKLGDIRRMHKDQCVVIPNGGWHSSYLGGVSAMQHKMNTFCHADIIKQFNTPENILASIARGVDLFNRGEKFTPEYIDTTYPRSIQEFPQFIGKV